MYKNKTSLGLGLDVLRVVFKSFTLFEAEVTQTFTRPDLAPLWCPGTMLGRGAVGPRTDPSFPSPMGGLKGHHASGVRQVQ